MLMVACLDGWVGGLMYVCVGGVCVCVCVLLST